MTRSHAFRLAQLSGLADELIAPGDKLDALRILMDAEDTAKFTEDAMKRAEEKE